MKDFNRCRQAMITTELAVSLILVAVVLFVTLGLFSDNLQEMISKGNFNNMFKGNYGSTFFSAFQRDYSGSQVEVQTMGEQGLEVIRKNANNSAEQLIDQTFEKPNGQTDVVTGTTIAYLVGVVKVIVGNPTICTTMEKPSKDPCEQIDGVENKYLVEDGASNALVIRRAYDSNGTLASRKTIAKNSRYHGDLSSIRPEISIAANSFSTADIADYKSKIKAIQGMSANFKGKINSAYALTRLMEVQAAGEKFAKVTQTVTTSTFGDKLLALLDQTITETRSAFNECHGRQIDANGNVVDIDLFGGGLDHIFASKCDGTLSIDDYKTLVTWVNAMKIKIKSYNAALANSGGYAGNTPVVGGQEKAYIPSSTMVAQYSDMNYSKSNLGSFNTANGQLTAGSEDALLIAQMRCDVTYDSDGLEAFTNCYNPSTQTAIRNANSIALKRILAEEDIGISYQTYAMDDNLIQAGANAVQIEKVLNTYENMAEAVTNSQDFNKIVNILVGGDKVNKISAGANLLLALQSYSQDYNMPEVAAKVARIKSQYSQVADDEDEAALQCQACQRETAEASRYGGNGATPVCTACY